MRWCASMVLLVALLAVAAPESSAQWFGVKKSKTPAKQRVPELLFALKLETDGHKRADAAEELRQYDPKDFPEIIPSLVEALQTDAVARVRNEAATSLGRLRPFSVPAAQALEKAASSDANPGVRLHAQTSLIYYKLSGYHAPKKAEPQGPVLSGRTDEPPLAETGGPWWKNGPGSAKVPPSMPGPLNPPRPLPSGPLQGPQVPVETVPASPPQQQPQPQPPAQGPIIQPTPPVIPPPPQPVWSPVHQEGPTLLPPKQG